MKYLLAALLVALVPISYHSYTSYRSSKDTELALERIAEHACHDSPEKQIAKLQRVLAKDPASLEARWMLAETYDCTGDYTKEEHHYNLAIRYAPRNAESYYRLGEFYLLRKHMYPQAVSTLRKCLALNSNCNPARELLARSYEKMGNSNAALKTWGEILEQRPNDEIAKRAVQRLRHGIED